MWSFDLQMATMVATTDVNSSDIKKVKAYIAQDDARPDRQLRLELNDMSLRLEEKNTELMGKFAALENIVAQVQMGGTSSADPPGLAGLAGLQATFRAIEETLRITLPKVDGIARSQENLQRKTTDLGHDFEHVKASMAVELEQTRTFITECVVALQGAANAAAASAASDITV